MEGWIKLHRKFINWEWYKNANTMRLFLHLLLKAASKKTNLKGIELEAGQLVTGRKKLAEELNLSEDQIRHQLNHLQMTNEITIKTTNKYSIITICKYGDYQSAKTKKQPAESPAESPNIDQQNPHIQEEYKNKEDLIPLTPFEKVFNEWLDYKKEIKDFYKTERGISTARKHLEEYSGGDPEIAQKIIEQSIANNWKGLFELKRNETNQKFHSRRDETSRLAADAAADLFIRITGS